MRPIRVKVSSPCATCILTKVNLPPGGDSAKRGTRMLVKVEFDVPYFVPHRNQTRMEGLCRIRSLEFSVCELPKVGFVRVVEVGLQVARHRRHWVCAVVSDGVKIKSKMNDGGLV
jgi:hypothetical protein